MTRQNFVSWLLFIALALIWGSSFIIMKRATRELTGWQIGAVRITSAGLAVLPFAIFHFSKIPFRKLPLVFLSGLLGNLFPALLFATALERKIDSSLASILNSLTPLFAIATGVLFFRLKVNAQKIIGVLIGLVGLVALTFSKGRVSINDLGSTVLILIATAMYGLNVNLVGKYMQGLDPVKIATVSMALIAIPAGLVMWQQNVVPIFRYDNQGRDAILLVALLGVTGTAIATILFYMLIQKAGGVFASLVTYAIPVVGVGWGLLDGERIGTVQILCLVVICSGVFVANKKVASH